MSDQPNKRGRLPLSSVQEHSRAKGIAVPTDGDLSLVRRMQAVSRMYRMIEVAEYREKIESETRTRVLGEFKTLIARQDFDLMDVDQVKRLIASLEAP